MRGKHTSRPRYRMLLALLVVFSLVALLLPVEWTGKLISLTQVVVPFQRAATTIADTVDRAFDQSSDPPSRAAYEALERQKAASEHRIAALTIRIAELEEEVALLTATRLWDAGGGRIGAHGRLIPAGVVVADLLPWRSSRLVDAGSLQGVRRGAPVISRAFTIDRGDEARLRNGLAVLLGEVLIGFVDQVGTHTARVKLLSDVSVQMKVRIGRFTDDGFTPLEGYFWLTGRGGDKMEIRDAERRAVEEGLIQVGDTVLSDPSSKILPSAMVIGRVTAIEPDRKNPLLVVLKVQSTIDLSSLRRVYVYDPQQVVEEVEPMP